MFEDVFGKCTDFADTSSRLKSKKLTSILSTSCLFDDGNVQRGETDESRSCAKLYSRRLVQSLFGLWAEIPSRLLSQQMSNGNQDIRKL